MRKLPAALLMATAMSMAALPVVAAAPAQADVCGDVATPGADANGCLPPVLNSVEQGAAVVGGIAVADALDEWHQRASGQPPCFTPQGVPYYTPGDSPCA